MYELNLEWMNEWVKSKLRAKSFKNKNIFMTPTKMYINSDFLIEDAIKVN